VNWFSGFQSEIPIVDDVLMDWFSVYFVHYQRPALQHIEGGKMLHKTERYCIGLDFTVPELILIEWLTWKSILLQRELFSHNGQAYSVFQ